MKTLFLFIISAVFYGGRDIKVGYFSFLITLTEVLDKLRKHCCKFKDLLQLFQTKRKKILTAATQQILNVFSALMYIEIKS